MGSTGQKAPLGALDSQILQCYSLLSLYSVMFSLLSLSLSLFPFTGRFDQVPNAIVSAQVGHKFHASTHTYKSYEHAISPMASSLAQRKHGVGYDVRQSPQAHIVSHCCLLPSRLPVCNVGRV